MTENLTRQTAKIFANNAPQSAMGQFGSALNGTKVNTTDITQIQALPAYETGWTAAVVTNRNYPTLEETNGVLKVMSYQTAYTLQKGVPEWDANTTYYSGDICKAVGSGVLYVSRADNNVNNPLNNNTYWREYQPSASELPATNYISEMSGTPAFNGNAVTLPAMTLYIPNGRAGNNTLVNQVENIVAKSYTVNAADGEYTLFYNNETQNLHLAADYISRMSAAPEIGNTGDVWYSTNNKMYVVESTNPNYTISEGVTVSSDGVVSGLGTLTFNGITSLPENSTLNLSFTTGADITTPQSLFSMPYAVGTISDGALNIAVSSTAYGVNYHSIIYSGSYTLQSNETLYSFTLGQTTVYSASALQLGLVLYTDDTLATEYGTVTQLSGESITVSTISTVYDGGYTLVTSGTYYTYLMGSTNYYTSEALANGVTVYTDTTLETVFGIANDVTASDVLIQSYTTVYSGSYTTNPEENIYTYTIGNNTIYASGVLIPGLIVYSNKELTTEYGVCENVTQTNVVIHSTDENLGYVANQGNGSVPVNVNIYSDINLQSQVATSTGSNAVYTGLSQKSQVGNLTYTLAASTAYAGSLSFSGTSYNLILNSVSTSLLSSRVPYNEGLTVTIGGTSSFTGTVNLDGTNIPNTWTWNGFNTTTPDWVETPLCKLGSITVSSGDVTLLNIDYPIELVKMSDIANLNVQGGGGGLEVGDIGISLFVDETKGLRRYLNGSILSINANTQGFVNKLKSIAALYPSLTCSETEWQEIAAASAVGQCGKFVINEDAGTVRLAKIVMPIQGLIDLTKLGQLVEAGLPNITGDLISVFRGNAVLSGLFEGTNKTINSGVAAGSGSGYDNINFDASRSNPIYGNSETVQPEQIQYPYFIQIATGQETEVNIQNQIELNNPYSLFDSKYSEASIYNLSWLLSNGTYYPKSIYTTAYEALLVEYNSEVMQGEAVELPSGGSYIKRGLPVVTMAPEVMTSTHTATSGWSNLENAFDNNASTYASCGTGTDYIEITFNSPVNVYEFTAAGNYVGAVARACNMAIYSVDEEGEETLLANSAGAAQTTKYTTSASLSGDTVSKLRLYLIAGPTGAPTTQYPTRITEIKIATAQAQTATDYDFVVNTTDETFKLPLKNGSEGMFGGAAVVGNGFALGLYDGTAYNGLIYNTSSSLSGRANVYGSNVGQTGTGSSTLGNNAAIGITTDPAKSGLVTTQGGVVPQGWYLYFYVGETVQNANLINATALAKNANRQLSNLANVGMSQYNIFSVNTGVVDADGEPAFLVETGNTIATSGTFTATTASGDIYTISQTLTYDKSLLPAGDYNIWIDPVEKQITLDQKVFTIGKKFPDDAADGDYLLNISQLPYKLQIFSSTSEPSESNKILCGTATVATA